VRTLYAKTGRALLPPLGFNNTFAILVRGADARSRGLRTIDDAARESPHWRAGFGYEFVERPDGYPLALAKKIRFSASPMRRAVMDLTLSYRALASGQVDLIAGDADGGADQGTGPHATRRHAALFSRVRRGRGRTRGDAAAPIRGAHRTGAACRAHFGRRYAGDELLRRT